MELKNIFSKVEKHENFSWSRLGGIKDGRGDLGEEMPVLVYRLMQYTMLDELSKAYGLEKANEHFRNAGFLAGMEFAKNTQDLKVDFDTFLANLQKALEELRIGILRMETFDAGTGNIVLTVEQDLDCSGLPITNENVCIYDEGFIAGILEAYTGKRYDVCEIDCWASGDRVCRFNGTVMEEEQM
ncbi:MAG: 4-vinyl reductase [Oscillospiraceae bacterium]|jgi:predicted hydrocarbon binding protein|nr:4-vinyl reductase [Oscillospiraceae bacterium]